MTGDVTPFHWPDKAKPDLLRIRLDGIGWDWYVIIRQAISSCTRTCTRTCSRSRFHACTNAYFQINNAYFQINNAYTQINNAYAQMHTHSYLLILIIYYFLLSLYVLIFCFSGPVALRSMRQRTSPSRCAHSTNPMCT